jgi:Leucine-rich repeat (LRR) protein
MISTLNVLVISDLSSKIRHIRELDLTDNLLSDWSDVMNILISFKSLTFLNLSNNLLSEPLDNDAQDNLDNFNLAMEKVSISCNICKSTNLSQLVLNGNLVSWPTVVFLAEKMPRLEELHLNTNNLPDPAGIALQVRRWNEVVLT